MPAGRAIDRLKKAANLKSTRRAVILANGDEFEFWAKPLTMSERERAQKDAKSEEITQYALQLVVSKCLDENGGRMFNPGDISVLRNEVRDSDLQQIMVAVVQGDLEDQTEELDMKSA